MQPEKPVRAEGRKPEYVRVRVGADAEDVDFDDSEIRPSMSVYILE